MRHSFNLLFCAAILYFQALHLRQAILIVFLRHIKRGLVAKTVGQWCNNWWLILKLFLKNHSKYNYCFIDFCNINDNDGTTLINLYNAFKHLFKSGRVYRDYIEKTAKEIEERRQGSSDVNLGPTSSDVQNDEPKSMK